VTVKDIIMIMISGWIQVVQVADTDIGVFTDIG
jgi:hypothetical protein